MSGVEAMTTQKTKGNRNLCWSPRSCRAGTSSGVRDDIFSRSMSQAQTPSPVAFEDRCYTGALYTGKRGVISQLTCSIIKSTNSSSSSGILTRWLITFKQITRGNPPQKMDFGPHQKTTPPRHTPPHPPLGNRTHFTDMWHCKKFWI